VDGFLFAFDAILLVSNAIFEIRLLGKKLNKKKGKHVKNLQSFKYSLLYQQACTSLIILRIYKC